MSDVQFVEENNIKGRFGTSAGTPTLVRLVLKIGLAKNEKQANYVLIGVTVCALLLTAYVIKTSFGNNARPNQNILPPAGAFPVKRS